MKFNLIVKEIHGSLPRVEHDERQGDDAVVVVPGVRVADRHLPAPVQQALPLARVHLVVPARLLARGEPVAAPERSLVAGHQVGQRHQRRDAEDAGAGQRQAVVHEAWAAAVLVFCAEREGSQAEQEAGEEDVFGMHFV